MKTKRLTLISLLVLGSLILSACGGQGLSNNWHGLAADTERAYISNGTFVYGVDLKTGREVWRYPAEADSKLMFYATPVLTPDGQLLIGSAGTKHPFVSLDPATGKEKWAVSFTENKGAWLASPLVFNDRIYAPNTDGFLYIIDMDGRRAADPIELGGALWSAPSTDGSLLFVTSLDHHFHVIDPVAGVSAESIDLGGAAPSSPTIGSDGVYVGSFATTIELIKSNGRHDVIATAENWIWGTPILDGDTLYYADLDGRIYSLDLASGNQNWDAVQPDGPIVASLLIVGDQIYVATEAGTLVALDRDGKTIWEKTVGGKIYTTPVVSGDLILAAPYQADFVLAAYDAAGKQAWTFVPEK
ncbi:MAG TPA: PQQ-binding-like beta-propeller repeat protein [Anaerolineales bacterium]|nr:PQQ-binding-like beta-propeller repeat protein [Anaerolineales bacterium]